MEPQTGGGRVYKATGNPRAFENALLVLTGVTLATLEGTFEELSLFYPVLVSLILSRLKST